MKLSLKCGLKGLLCCVFGVAGLAHAQTWSVGIGVLAKQAAYKDYDAEVIGVPLLVYQGQYVFIEGTKAGVYLVDSGAHRLSLNVEVSVLRFNASRSDDDALRLLDDRKMTLMAGLGYRYRFSSWGDVSIDVAGDALGRSDGVMARIGYMYPIQMDRWRIELGAGLTWYSGNYNDYYYGVSPREAQRSGLEQYNAGSSLSPDVFVRTSYMFNEHWQVFAMGGVSWHRSAVTDSPMVERRYDARVAVGLFYHF